MPKATVGRIVHYYPFSTEIPGGMPGAPCAAIITYVWGPDVVNLSVFPPHGGVPVARTSVRIEPEDAATVDGTARWPSLEE